jgi:Flp pilus assembly protein TadG
MLNLDDMPLPYRRGARTGVMARRIEVLARRRMQAGTIAIIVAVSLAVIVGFMGLALDLSRLYNRKVEMQNVADAAALAAAQKLDGTANGIDAALAAAQSVAQSFQYQYTQLPVSWSDAAVTFSTSPDRNGTWLAAGAAAGSASNIFYAKVDTSQLDPAQGAVPMVFMSALSPAYATVNTSGSAVAGRGAIDVTPLALCALSDTPAAARTNSASYVELVEYGFRRGVSYNLMRLNPNGTTPANYVVNPIAPAGAAGSATDTDASTVGPDVCSGSMASPALLSGTVRVTSPFPLDSLYNQLNSRFDRYDGDLCDPQGAPPDKNIQEYPVSASLWMTTKPAGQTAAETTSGNILRTIADLPPPGGTASQYGPVWAYAKAVQYAASEPSPGYSAFGTSSWSTLYGGQTPKNYPSGSINPYKTTTGAYFLAPSAGHQPGLADRRVLNVPLLSCPIAAGTNVVASVLAIGKFFMTVRADSATISGEFAGAMPIAKVTGTVELYR